LAVGAVGLLVAVDRMVTTGQDKFHYVAEFGWPNHFETASTLAWFAVAALGADALVQEVRDRRARKRARPGDDAGDDAGDDPSDGAGDGDAGGNDTRSALDAPSARDSRRRRQRRGKHARGVSPTA
jgi:hypothetical protein